MKKIVFLVITIILSCINLNAQVATVDGIDINGVADIYSRKGDKLVFKDSDILIIEADLEKDVLVSYFFLFEEQTIWGFNIGFHNRLDKTREAVIEFLKINKPKSKSDEEFENLIIPIIKDNKPYDYYCIKDNQYGGFYHVCDWSTSFVMLVNKIKHDSNLTECSTLYAIDNNDNDIDFFVDKFENNELSDKSVYVFYDCRISKYSDDLVSVRKYDLFSTEDKNSWYKRVDYISEGVKEKVLSKKKSKLFAERNNNAPVVIRGGRIPVILDVIIVSEFDLCQKYK